MTLSKIEKSIDITASPETIWNVLFNKESYSTWAAAFSDGAYVDTDWQEGSKVIFTDNSHAGLIGTITKSDTPHMLAITYSGVFIDGKEVFDSKEAEEMNGGVERYTLEEMDGGTHLHISSDMSPEYVDTMSQAWDKALQIIKQLSEKNQ